ncbi:MAG: hypothetical protein HY000_28655 [Planctomycetes bacterium]|nr:hypothetical protein [Planctomycetota bacterium]
MSRPTATRNVPAQQSWLKVAAILNCWFGECQSITSPTGQLDNSLAVPEAAPRWTDADEERWCRAQGCKAGWVAYANFWHDHPEFSAQMLVTEKDPSTGQSVPVKPYKRVPYRRVLSLAYPEVRAFYIKFFKQLASTGTPGIMIDLLRHPPIAGYEPIVADAFKEKYGMEMETRDVYHDPLVQEHLSQYLRAFLVELRKEIGPDIEISVRSSGPEKYSLRGKEWIAEGLIDTIVDGNWYSGNGPRPTIDATVAAASARDTAAGGVPKSGGDESQTVRRRPGQAFAIAESGDVAPQDLWKKRDGNLSPEAIAALAKHYSGRGVARFGLYESTVFTWDPAARRAIRQAGWNHDPKKAIGSSGK